MKTRAMPASLAVRKRSRLAVFEPMDVRFTRSDMHKTDELVPKTFDADARDPLTAARADGTLGAPSAASSVRPLTLVQFAKP
ncbi:MAG: hypothetical protein ABI595_14735, partial [Actinomycetota bacterium]